MPALSGGHVSQLRNFALAAVLILGVYFLLQSFYISPGDIEQSTRESLRAISQFAPQALRGSSPRITKVAAVTGEENELYEAALRSHEEHNRLHGYDMKVSRERIANDHRSTTSYLLTVLVNELAKPAEQRTEWLVCFAPDVVILNPNIPLEVFLPPSDFSNVRFLGTHNGGGFDNGVFFLRVHEWSAKLLLEALSVPRDIPKITQARNKAQKALELALQPDEFNKYVSYQPKAWYNSAPPDAESFADRKGELLVHFDEEGGDKWSAMGNMLDELDQYGSVWTVPLSEMTYEREVKEYWNRLRQIHDLLNQAWGRSGHPEVAEAIRRCQYAATHEADRTKVMNEAIEMLKHALG